MIVKERSVKKTYNHAFDIAFAVPGSQYEKWEDCQRGEKHIVIAALLRRVADLVDHDDEYMESLGSFDTYEE